MVTLMDCIERVPSVVDVILEKREETFKPFRAWIAPKLDEIDEIVFIGSGTSNTSAMTSYLFTEKTSGLPCRTLTPCTGFEEERVLSKKALYVFTSQTGTSIETRRLQKVFTDKGLFCVCMTESAETPLAKEAQMHVCLNCGVEEYGQRTIGYCASILTHMLMAMEIGLLKKTLTDAEYDALLKQAKAAAENRKQIVPAARKWFHAHRRQIMRSDCVIFTGSGALFGVALEGAVKFWEMPQIIAVGYELEEGLHGPNYGYCGRHCVIVLNDGGKDGKKALSLARYMKEVNHNGFVFGNETADGDDLKFDVIGGPFEAIEFSAAVQAFAYDLTEDGGRDLTVKSDHSVMESYFKTHA